MNARSFGDVTVRIVRPRDAKVLQHELLANRAWLSPWEATLPGGMVSGDMRGAIRRQLQLYREEASYPYVIEYQGAVVGQLSVWGVQRGSLRSATIGYWVAERVAGRGITPTAVALVTDMMFREVGLHRIEICMRPENAASIRVARKLGFRYEGYRPRYIHIDGDWRDHLAFALTSEDVPGWMTDRLAGGAEIADDTRQPTGDGAPTGLPWNP